MTRMLLLPLLAGMLAACSAPPPRPAQLDSQIAAELNQVAEPRPRMPDERVREALLPPLRAELPTAGMAVIEPKFDLVVNNAPANQVFMSIVSGTRYSMLVHPSVTGAISINLKDANVREALDSIRDLYGYEYRIDGTRILIQPVTIQSRVFNVNYLIGQRSGRSDVRVTSGSVSDAPAAATTGAAPGTAPNAATGAAADSSRIQTQTANDFWADLSRTLQAIVGTEEGRSVVINPQAGIVVARALPMELRNVEAYLRAIRVSVERQVMLEAKIIEVTLNERYQSGVNWAAFPTSGLTVGQTNPGTLLRPNGVLATGAGSITGLPAGAGDISGESLSALPGSYLLNRGGGAGSLLGLAFQTANFAALLQFLESQGSVQVLSSPRIATINNQKAVLKVGTDDFFPTGISGGTATSTSTTGTATPAFPSITLRPFFSGVALDVTPQIDQDSNIILHVHPSVSKVETSNRVINLGANFGGQVSLPLASSTVSETDSIVKVGDGNIVAIGGLMKIDIADERAGLPGAQDAPVVGGLFRNTTRSMVKKELVILIKPTVVQTGDELIDNAREARTRLLNTPFVQEGR